MWDMIVSVPEHCLSFYFIIIFTDFENRLLNTSVKAKPFHL